MWVYVAATSYRWSELMPLAVGIGDCAKTEQAMVTTADTRKPILLSFILLNPIRLKRMLKILPRSRVAPECDERRWRRDVSRLSSAEEFAHRCDSTRAKPRPSCRHRHPGEPDPIPEPGARYKPSPDERAICFHSRQ